MKQLLLLMMAVVLVGCGTPTTGFRGIAVERKVIITESNNEAIEKATAKTRRLKERTAEIKRFCDQNNANISKLEIGMTKDEVQKAMSNGFEFPNTEFPYYSARPALRGGLKGSPRRREVHEALDGGTLEF